MKLYTWNFVVWILSQPRHWRRFLGDGKWGKRRKKLEGGGGCQNSLSEGRGEVWEEDGNRSGDRGGWAHEHIRWLLGPEWCFPYSFKTASRGAGRLKEQGSSRERKRERGRESSSSSCPFRVSLAREREKKKGQIRSSKGKKNTIRSASGNRANLFLRTHFNWLNAWFFHRKCILFWQHPPLLLTFLGFSSTPLSNVLDFHLISPLLRF